MKTISVLPALAVLLASHGAPAASTSELTRAPFPAEVVDVDFGSETASGCQLTTSSPGDSVRLRWIPSETSVDRMSIDTSSTTDPVGKVKARVKVPLTKIGESDGVAVYGYREANAVVLIVPGKDMFATMTQRAERTFMTQTCGIGITLLFTKSPTFGADGRIQGDHFPGFEGKMARLEGRISKETSVSVTAGLRADDKISLLIKTRPANPVP